MVVADHRADLRVLDLAEQRDAVDGVALDDPELAVGQLAGLVEDLARRVELLTSSWTAAAVRIFVMSSWPRCIARAIASTWRVTRWL
jgi:hypothetical protein